MIPSNKLAIASAPQLNPENRPMSAEAKNDIAFVFDQNEGKQLLQGWRKLFYSTAKLSGSHKTQTYFSV